MRAVVLALVRLLLRVFFRRVEVVGEARLPHAGGVVYAPNHPNGLIDPLFLLVLPERPASFLAKEPLFRMPVVGWFVRALGCLPVYRAKDGHDTKANKRTLAAARARLENGGAIGVFPEGISHSELSLQPLKTGAARIALGAAAESREPVHVVPCALHYTEKITFRSLAVLVYGAPLEVPRVELDAAGEPPREHAVALTERIEGGLHEVLVQAESPSVLALVAAAIRLLEGVRRSRGERALPALEGAEQAGAAERDWRLQRRMLERYAERQRQDPGRVAELAERLRELELAFALRGMQLSDAPSDARAGAAWHLRALVPWLIAPVALLGIVLHYPLYRTIGALALRAAGAEQDVVASAKLLLGTLAFAAQWVLVALGVGYFAGALPALITLAAMPALAWLTLRWSEWLSAVLGRLRIGRLRGDQAVRRLLDERERLYEDLVALDQSV